ncbi:MAG: DNA-binding transcriptional regulator Fis [Pseudomonadales bacterium]|nr:MAG: DNA-binding transcriptional regulator Fis [Pseudomonadales bacterium]
MNVPISTSVEQNVRNYFEVLDGESTTDLYELILSQMERPLLQVVLEQTNGNQSKSAKILGLNRGTLRKKLQQYDLL